MDPFLKLQEKWTVNQGEPDNDKNEILIGLENCTESIFETCCLCDFNDMFLYLTLIILFVEDIRID